MRSRHRGREGSTTVVINGCRSGPVEQEGRGEELKVLRNLTRMFAESDYFRRIPISEIKGGLGFGDVWMDSPEINNKI